MGLQNDSIWWVLRAQSMYETVVGSYHTNSFVIVFDYICSRDRIHYKYSLVDTNVLEINNLAFNE